MVPSTTSLFFGLPTAPISALLIERFANDSTYGVRIRAAMKESGIILTEPEWASWKIGAIIDGDRPAGNLPDQYNRYDKACQRGWKYFIGNLKGQEKKEFMVALRAMCKQMKQAFREDFKGLRVSAWGQMTEHPQEVISYLLTLAQSPFRGGKRRSAQLLPSHT